MIRPPLSMLVVLPFLVSAGPNASAQPPVAGPPALEQRIAGLERAIQDLVVVLRRQAESRTTELLLRRVEVAVLKLGPLRQERREIQSRLTADQQHLQQLQTVRAAQASLEPNPEVAEDPDAAVRPVFLDLEAKQLKSRIAEASLRLGELDAEIQQEERNIRDWEARIEAQLAKP